MDNRTKGFSRYRNALDKAALTDCVIKLHITMKILH
jgi:hypothetical protein